MLLHCVSVSVYVCPGAPGARKEHKLQALLLLFLAEVLDLDMDINNSLSY